MWRIGELQGCARQAWEWQQRYPRFLQYGLYDSFDEFRESFDSGLSFGGWEGKLKVIAHGEEKGEIVEGHLFCEPNADIDLVAATTKYGCKVLKKKYRNILLETPAKHRTIRKMLESIGFHDIGLSAYRGRTVETVHYLI